MNRRTLSLSLLAAPLLSLGSYQALARPVSNAWRMLGRKKIRANDKELLIDLGEPQRDLRYLEIRATTQSLRIDSVTLYGFRGRTWTKQFGMELPPGGKMSFAKDLADARKLFVQLYYLPYDNEPTHVELWGGAEPGDMTSSAT